MRNGKYQKRDITALEKSIKHWKKDNLEAACPEEVRLSSEFCALCYVYTEQKTEVGNCDGCPVSEHTGIAACENTPYYDVCALKREWENSGKKPQRLRNVIKKEIAFLEKLLKEAKAQFAKEKA